MGRQAESCWQFLCLFQLILAKNSLVIKAFNLTEIRAEYALARGNQSKNYGSGYCKYRRCYNYTNTLPLWARLHLSLFPTDYFLLEENLFRLRDEKYLLVVD